MEAKVWLGGLEWTVLYLADGTEEFAPTFLDDLSDADRKKVVALLVFICEHGLPKNEEKFRQFEGVPGLAELKAGAARFPCFFDGPRRLVVTHGFKKQGQKPPKREITRALELRGKYLVERRARGER